MRNVVAYAHEQHLMREMRAHVGISILRFENELQRLPLAQARIPRSAQFKRASQASIAGCIPFYCHPSIALGLTTATLLE